MLLWMSQYLCKYLYINNLGLEGTLCNIYLYRHVTMTSLHYTCHNNDHI